MDTEHPVLFTIFGISGDLAKRKLIPALYRLTEQAAAPQHFTIVGISRQPDYTVEELLQGVAQQLPDANPHQLEYLKKHITIVHNPLGAPRDFTELKKTLQAESKALGQGTIRLYYLSIPPAAFPDLVANLGASGHSIAFSNEATAPRLLVEKPFGYDYTSAKALIDAASAEFGEKQVYRIDHYLAKETAQNIMAFRFKNALFDNVWNDQYIESISVVAHETLDIEGRAGFYDKTGALRDIIQSHLLQLLALILMDEPATLTSQTIHSKKLAVLKDIKPVSTKDAFRAQYAGYKQSVDDPQSHTETFARLTLRVANNTWRHTDITLQTGKALHQKTTCVNITFKPKNPGAVPNTLQFRLQPTEGVTLVLQAKRPGLTNTTQTAHMTFDYKHAFDTPTSEAYERVLMDAVRGDKTLFASGAEVLASWKIVDTVIADWAKDGDGLAIYPIGTDPSTLH